MKEKQLNYLSLYDLSKYWNIPISLAKEMFLVLFKLIFRMVKKLKI